MEPGNVYQGRTDVGGSSSRQGLEQSGAIDGEFRLSRLISIVLRRWVTVVLLGIAGILSGILYTQLTPSVYKAYAELEMSVRRPKVINSEAVFDDINSVRDTDVIFNTRFAKFKSPAMERLATEEFIQRYGDLKRTPAGLEVGRYTLANWIREDVSWSKDPDANIVRVSYESTDPEFAAHLVNVLTHCAGVLMMKENQALSDEAVKWLISQVAEQRAELEEVEKELAITREDLQLDSLQQRKATLGQAMISVSQEKENLISQLSSRKTVYVYVSGLKKLDMDLEMLPTGLPKEEQLNELSRVWREASNELVQIASRYTERHPEYRKAADNEARARRRLEEFIDLSSMAVQNEIDLLEKQVEQVNHRIDAMKTEAVGLEQNLVLGTQQIQRIERKRDAADNAYQSMLRRMEEARLSADENMAFTKVIRNAEVPRIPIRPRKVRAWILFIFLGLLGGSGLAIVMELWMDRVSSVSDMKMLGLNILGAIPTQKKIDSRGELSTIGLRDKFNHLVEIFAGINALISSGIYADKTTAMLICSVMPGEGKTVSACNLAISSALNGARTLLIDGDLRRPQLDRIFSIDEEHTSLLEWLSNNEDRQLTHEQLVTKNIIENLDVITSRPIKEVNPAELLGRKQLSDLLTWARGQYDRVIIDSPPLGPVGDGLVLANLVDSVIIVSRIGKTRRRGLRFALSRFRETNAHVLGGIANAVPNTLVGLFGGAEGYGYTYGYGSGYKSDERT
jgi:capsular exopolysaccharide synthesis family protein